MSHLEVKYSRLSGDSQDQAPYESVQAQAEEPPSAFNFSSTFTYDDNTKYKRPHSYESVFSYGTNIDHMGHNSEEQAKTNQGLWLVATSWILTFLSYFFFVVTLPVSYWLFVKKMGEFDRMVVFRLGKMVGIKGPGRFIIFPWMDRVKKVDIRASAFAVPPQQFITADGGIAELGAEIQYGIVDLVTMIREVADHQDILRSLGKTLLVKILVKKNVSQLLRDRKVPEREIMDAINDQVRKWGINVQSVSLSEAKILKQPENGGDSAVGTVLTALGMKEDTKYPSPLEFVRSQCGTSDTSSNNAPTINMSILQGLSTNGKLPTIEEQRGNTKSNTTWAKCIEEILNSEFSGSLEDDAHGLYKIEVNESENEQETFFVDLSAKHKIVFMDNKLSKEPDVAVNISASDLGNILNGSLAPLQAYLTGRIVAQGDVKKLMFLDKLSKRSHKPGTMFTI